MTNILLHVQKAGPVGDGERGTHTHTHTHTHTQITGDKKANQLETHIKTFGDNCWRQTNKPIGDRKQPSWRQRPGDITTNELETTNEPVGDK